MATNMKICLLCLMISVLCAGCANTRVTEARAEATAQNDARTVRGLVDAMRSPVHSFPANIPR